MLQKHCTIIIVTVVYFNRINDAFQSFNKLIMCIPNLFLDRFEYAQPPSDFSSDLCKIPNTFKILNTEITKNKIKS